MSSPANSPALIAVDDDPDALHDLEEELRDRYSRHCARPRTTWLPPEIDRDKRGFILTGKHAADVSPQPAYLETSMPGVFAAGDVRHGSVKRVASAVGEGSVAIQLLHDLFGSDQQKKGAGFRLR